jgi:acetyl-CoA synthetase
MQMMADLGVRNVFLPPTALKLMRQGRREASGRQAAQHFHRR